MPSPLSQSLLSSFLSSQVILSEGNLKEEASNTFMMLDKIHADISEHEKLVEKLRKSEQEHEAMKHAFEQKLNQSLNQLKGVEKERDLALVKIKTGNVSTEKLGVLAMKTRYDKQTSKIEQEISELKRKMNIKNETKIQNEVLVKNLMSTIKSMKG